MVKVQKLATLSAVMRRVHLIFSVLHTSIECCAMSAVVVVVDAFFTAAGRCSCREVMLDVATWYFQSVM